MLELTAKELAFGKKLAHVDKEVRDEAVGKISMILARDVEFTHMDMLRQWKALFYCFWLSDKPLVQQELAWNLAQMILSCKGVNRTHFVRAFWETVCREWFDVDKYRVDKFYLLMRRMVFFTFRSMHQSGWDEELVDEFMAIYTEFSASSTNMAIPHSIRTHVADIYVDELVRLNMTLDGEDQDAAIPADRLLEPFMRFIGESTIRHLPPIIQESVFENIVVRIAEAEERAAKQADDSGESSDEADTITGNELANEKLSDLQFLIDSMGAIKARILSVGGSEAMRSIGRKRLYALYQALCDTFPDTENDVVIGENIVVHEPVGAEERKAADKHKRKKMVKLNAIKEAKKQAKRDAKKAKRAMERAIISTSDINMDVNALEHTATAEEERKYREDIVRINEMRKKAGFGPDGDDESRASRPKSNKEKRVLKKKSKASNSKPLATAEEIPSLVPIAAEWSVQTKGSKRKAADAKQNGSADEAKRPKPGKAPSLLERSERAMVVKAKRSEGKKQGSAQAAKSNGRASVKKPDASPRESGKDKGLKSPDKKLTWALERNSMKRFLKKVPLIPIAEPVEVSDAELRPALRKTSAYADVSESAARTEKPVVRKINKKNKPKKKLNGGVTKPKDAQQMIQEYLKAQAQAKAQADEKIKNWYANY